MRKLMQFALIALLVVYGGISCQKGVNDTPADTNFNGEFTVAQAKQWYRESFQSTELWKSAWAESKKLVDWKNPIIKKSGNREMIEFPLQKQHSKLMVPGRNLSSTQIRQVVDAALTKVVFIKSAGNRIIIREIDYIPDFDYLQRHSFNISKSSLGLSGDDFSGVIIVKDWKGVTISMRMVTNGKITKRISHSPRSISRTQSCQYVEYCMWYEDCEVVGDQWTNNCGEPYMDPNDCYMEYECDEEGEEDPCILYGECGGGGGGENGGGSPSPLESVDNQIVDPCKSAALATLTDPKIKNFVTGFYNNFLVPTDSKFNLVIKEGSDLTVNGATVPAYSTNIGGNTWEITLSNNYYTSGNGYNMSQQAWAQIIAHEIVHVAIMANNLTPVPGTDHLVMFANFIEPMRDLLEDAFSLSADDALKLALSGMNDLWGYSDFAQMCQDKYGLSLSDIQAGLANYTTGSGGTKCN